jgi:tRNA dimethylallyltransferase
VLIYIVCGATASGKSARALELAVKHDACVINADSQQVYRDLPILTAQPRDTDKKIAPHYLYGHIAADVRYNAATWRQEVLAQLEQTPRAVIVGGTGLYLKALLAGLPDIPPIPKSIQEQVADMPLSEAYQQLTIYDPLLAERLKPLDSARIQRALSVYLATGKPLSYWQAQPTVPFPYPYQSECLLPDRSWLYARINKRFEEMIEHGSLDEVRTLLSLNNAPSMPVMKCLGVGVIRDYLNGVIDKPTLLEIGARQTRNYAKRQYTWFKHQWLSDGNHP